MFSGVDNLMLEKVKEDGRRVQDLETRLPREDLLTNNDVTMKFLSSSATLPEVIKKINELIKRDLTIGKVK